LSKTRGKRLIVKWTAPKGFAALLLFLILALFFEFLLVYSFQSFGLSDKNALTGTFQIPATNWSFIVSVSPLFHLLPITVIVVLVSSWTYQTKYTAFVPSRTEVARRTLPSTRRETEKHRFRKLRGFSKRISRRMQRIERSVKAGLQQIPGVSYVSKRLHFARAAVRSALVVLAVFLSMSLLLYIVVYPDLIHQGVVGLYRWNQSFLGFVTGTRDLVRGVGQALPPLGGLGTSINNALLGAAPGFRHGLAGVGTSLTSSIVGLDVAGKYVLSQNVAAWVSALVALIYGLYASSRRPRRR
jgi:hypothetical protein